MPGEILSTQFNGDPDSSSPQHLEHPREHSANTRRFSQNFNSATTPPEADWITVHDSVGGHGANRTLGYNYTRSDPIRVITSRELSWSECAMDAHSGSASPEAGSPHSKLLGNAWERNCAPTTTESAYSERGAAEVSMGRCESKQMAAPTPSALPFDIAAIIEAHESSELSSPTHAQSVQRCFSSCRCNTSSVPLTDPRASERCKWTPRDIPMVVEEHDSRELNHSTQFWLELFPSSIATFLSARDLCSLSRTCKLTFLAVNQPWTWKEAVMSTFQVSRASCKVIESFFATCRTAHSARMQIRSNPCARLGPLRLMTEQHRESADYVRGCRRKRGSKETRTSNSPLVASADGRVIAVYCGSLSAVSSASLAASSLGRERTVERDALLPARRVGDPSPEQLGSPVTGAPHHQSDRTATTSGACGCDRRFRRLAVSASRDAMRVEPGSPHDSAAADRWASPLQTDRSQGAIGRSLPGGVNHSQHTQRLREGQRLAAKVNCQRKLLFSPGHHRSDAGGEDHAPPWETLPVDRSSAERNPSEVITPSPPASASRAALRRSQPLGRYLPLLGSASPAGDGGTTTVGAREHSPDPKPPNVADTFLQRKSFSRPRAPHRLDASLPMNAEVRLVCAATASKVAQTGTVPFPWKAYFQMLYKYRIARFMRHLEPRRKLAQQAMALGVLKDAVDLLSEIIDIVLQGGCGTGGSYALPHMLARDLQLRADVYLAIRDEMSQSPSPRECCVLHGTMAAVAAKATQANGSDATGSDFGSELQLAGCEVEHALGDLCLSLLLDPGNTSIEARIGALLTSYDHLRFCLLAHPEPLPEADCGSTTAAQSAAFRSEELKALRRQRKKYFRSSSFDLDSEYNKVYLYGSVFCRAAFLAEVLFWRGQSLGVYLYQYFLCSELQYRSLYLLYRAYRHVTHPYQRLLLQAWDAFDRGNIESAVSFAELAASLVPLKASRYKNSRFSVMSECKSPADPRSAPQRARRQLDRLESSVSVPPSFAPEEERTYERVPTTTISEQEGLPEDSKHRAQAIVQELRQQYVTDQECQLLAAASSVDPLIGYVFFTLGFVGQSNEEVIEAYFRYLATNPPPSRCAVAYNNLASEFIAKGDCATAEMLLREAIVCSPQFVTAYDNLAKCYAKRGAASEAYELLSSLIDRAHRGAGDADNGGSDTARFSLWQPLNAETFAERSRCLDVDPWLDVNHATALNPRLSYPYRIRAAMLMDRGCYPEALRELRELIQLTLNPVDILLRARFHQDAGLLRHAVDDVCLAVLLSPQIKSYHELLDRLTAELLRQRGRSALVEDAPSSAPRTADGGAPPNGGVEFPMQLQGMAEEALSSWPSSVTSYSETDEDHSDSIGVGEGKDALPEVGDTNPLPNSPVTSMRAQALCYRSILRNLRIHPCAMEAVVAGGFSSCCRQSIEGGHGSPSRLPELSKGHWRHPLASLALSPLVHQGGWQWDDRMEAVTWTWPQATEDTRHEWGATETDGTHHLTVTL